MASAPGERATTVATAYGADAVLQDVDYVIGDTHFGHYNIIDYCRSDSFRYSDTGLHQMNKILVNRWNETVTAEDVVLHVGDFGRTRDQNRIDWTYDPETDDWARRTASEILDDLNGQIHLLRGNHDDGLSSEDELPVEGMYDAVVLEHDDRLSYATHYPSSEHVPDYVEDYTGCPDDWQTTVIHGHVHNHPATEEDDRPAFPFVDPIRRRSNVSVEVIDYRPVPVDTILDHMQAGRLIDHID